MEQLSTHDQAILDWINAVAALSPERQKELMPVLHLKLNWAQLEDIGKHMYFCLHNADK